MQSPEVVEPLDVADNLLLGLGAGGEHVPLEPFVLQRTGLLSHAGSLLLLKTLHITGLDRALSAQLEPWRPPRAIHDPSKIVADLAVALALGGDRLADIALLRAQPDLFGPIASDPTVSTDRPARRRRLDGTRPPRSASRS
jgi:hypothetical protein